ncbi:MAG: helix-hairpin-helix domain-containing protein [Kangiellaceae bacterium]|nr:helix-hairpin-helix domain-containing protein [Kangiellaceae bacterium]
MKSISYFLLPLILTFMGANLAYAKSPPKEVKISKEQAQGTTVNLNKADAKEIASVLKGIGLKKAQSIVDYRNKHGSFKAVEELASVKGIGVATIAKNHSKISL